MEKEKIYTVQELKELTGFTRGYLAKLCKEGELEGAYKKGSIWLIPPESAVLWLEAKIEENLQENKKFRTLIEKVK
jgi:hypothetical protein